jgi:hypothetical protein
MEPIINLSMNDLPDDLLTLIIANFCTDLSKFVLHFVSKKFRILTIDNKKNRDLGTSFVMCFVRENSYYKKRLCTLAASEGSLNILKWFRFNDYTWDSDVCSSAALKGNFEILKYAHDNGCPKDKYTCEYAATSNYLDILKWALLFLFASKKKSRENGFPWDSKVCESAASKGNLQVEKKYKLCLYFF